MRCLDCNRFVSFDTDNEPEIQSEDFDPESGDISIEVRIVNTCAECGTELTEATFELTDTVDEDVLKEHRGEEHKLELSDVEASRDESYQTMDRHGKPIKKARYQKHLYGVIVDYQVYCSCSSEPIHTGTLNDDIQASAMDELV